MSVMWVIFLPTVADLLMGIYLLIIASHDVSYRGNYNAHALQWTFGWGCQLTGILAMLSAEVSIAILTCISVERYLVITKPLNFVKIERKHALITLSAVWLLCLLLAVLPLLTVDPPFGFYANNGVCFPLHIQNHSMPGWQWSAVVFLGLNVVAIFTTAVCYVKMFVNIRRSHLEAKLPTESDTVVAKRFCWIIVAGILCTTPIIVCKILAFSGVVLPGESSGAFMIKTVQLVQVFSGPLCPLISSSFAQSGSNSAR